MLRNLPSSLAGLLATAVVLPAGGAPGWAADQPSRGGPVRVLIETIVVDGLGTNSVAQDEADIFPGQSGVLKKSVALRAREGSDDPADQVDLTARVSLADDDGPACPLMLSIVAAGVPRDGAPSAPAEAERKALSLTLQAGESRMTPAYLSPWNAARISLKITCDESQPADFPLDTSSVTFDVGLERGDGDAAPQLLRSDRLAATIGGQAGSLFSSNTPLPDREDGSRRYRREKLEVRLAPRVLSGDRLQVDVRLRGEIATVSASGIDQRHPIDEQQTLVLASGRPDDIGLTITATPEEEGWSRVHYVLRVTGHF